MVHTSWTHNYRQTTACRDPWIQVTTRQAFRSSKGIVAQVTRDLNDQGFEATHGDIRWLSQRKMLSAEKIYSSIVVTIANESKHRKLLESSGIFLDDQWHGN